MRSLARLRRVFRLDRVRPPLADEVDAEIAVHLDMRYEQLIAEGLPPEQARQEARRRFGDVAGTRAAIVALDQRQVTGTRHREWMQGMVQDAHHAVRMLRSTPTFSVIAATTLALGIGATAAIFSVVQQVLLRPLPFPAQQELVLAAPAHAGENGIGNPISVPDLDDWRESQHEFQALGGYWYAAEQSGVDLTGVGQPERLRAAHVTPGFFDVLGLKPERGRLPAADEMAEGGTHVVLLSNGLWQRRFGSDPRIIGRSITLSRAPFVVIGIMPPSMRFPGDGPDVWMSALYTRQDATPWKVRSVRWLTPVGRLVPGLSPERAAADLAVLQQHLAQTYQDADEGWTSATVTPLLDALVGEVRPALLILFAAAACVLLVACANIAALLLARATVREREFAVRGALGASRRRVLQQVLTESAVLALVGAVGGLIVTAIALPLLLHLAAGELPRLPHATLDWVVAGFTVIVGLIAGLVLGLPSALQLLAASGRSALSDVGGGTRGATAGTRSMRSRQVLVVAEVAVAVVLVCSASLMAKSFRRLLATDPGFRSDHGLVIGFTIADRFVDSQFIQYYQTILDRVRDVPGVVAVGATKILPLQGRDEPWGFGVAGETIVPVSQRPTAPVNHVSPGYFRAVGTALLGGREFTAADTSGAPQVAMVNDAFARRYFPGTTPNDLTHRALILGDTSVVPIVGVVHSAHERTLDAAPGPAIYLPAMQNPRSGVRLVVRTRDDPIAMTGAVERAIWSANRDQTINSVTTLGDIVQRSVARPRLLSVLLMCFGGLGLLLGALGIYGVVGFSVDARRHEIGVRSALGATRGQLLALVVGRGVALALTGIVTGLIIALLATRVMRSVLFHVAPTDIATYAVVTTVLALVAFVAAYLPARAATRIDATEALRTL
jgi:predicted permease